MGINNIDNRKVAQGFIDEIKQEFFQGMDLEETNFIKRLNSFRDEMKKTLDTHYGISKAELDEKRNEELKQLEIKRQLFLDKVKAYIANPTDGPLYLLCCGYMHDRNYTIAAFTKDEDADSYIKEVADEEFSSYDQGYEGDDEDDLSEEELDEDYRERRESHMTYYANLFDFDQDIIKIEGHNVEWDIPGIERSEIEF